MGNKIIFFMSMILLSACEIKVKSEPTEVKQSGESYTYLVVRVEFIEQIKVMCEDSNPIQPLQSIQDHKKIVADCTLSHMNLFNIDTTQATNFTKQYCDPNTDLSSLSSQEVQNILQMCSLLQ